MPGSKLRVLVPIALAALALLAVARPSTLDRASRAAGLRGQLKWETSSPEREAVSGQALERLWQDLDGGEDTKSLLIARHGKIVFEKYAPGWGPNRCHQIASMAKGLIGGVSLMLALSDGTLGLDQRAADLLPIWRGDSLRSLITLRQLATHTSGLANVRRMAGDSTAAGALEPWETAYWERRPGDFLATVLRDTPVTSSPGQRVSYSSPGYVALSCVLAEALRTGPCADVPALLEERIMRPPGIPPSHWSISYGATYEVDGLRVYLTNGGSTFTPRAAASIGQLLARRGEWNGSRLIDSRAAALALADNEDPALEDWSARGVPIPTLGFWSNARGAWPDAPRDAFAGLGAGHEILLVVPSLELVAVRFGGRLGRDKWEGDYWETLNSRFISPLMRAVQPDMQAQGP